MKFSNVLLRQPHFFTLNSTQDCFIVASEMDGLFVDIERNIEIDIDEEFEVSVIKDIEYDEDRRIFYVLANKCAGILGLYLIEIFEDDPHRSEFVFK